MATIENKPAAEWIRAAKERQAKGQFDETGAREAVQRAQGQAMPDYDAKGQIVRGPSGRTYNYKPTPAKPAKPETPKPAPEPARQVAAKPKPADHASPAKPAPAPAKKSETKPAPVAKTASEEGQERIANAKRMIAEHLATSRGNLERDIEIGRWKIEADAKQAEENRIAREAERKRDIAAATPGPVKMAQGAGILASRAGSGIAAAAKAAKRTVGGSYSRLGTYIGNEVEKGRKFYGGVGKWLTGDPEAKKRLAASAK
jgi:hypothetical protein